MLVRMQVAVAIRQTRERDTRPGRWVRAARVEAARRDGRDKTISQMELAVLIGKDKSAVYRWETPDGTIDYLSWVGMLTVLGLPAEWEPGKPDGLDDAG